MVRGAAQKVYISGPITNNPASWLSFKKAQQFLGSGGHKVYNPMDIEEPNPVTETEEETWVYYMKKALKMLLGADCIYMLEGWEESRGARMEFWVATQLNIPVHYAHEDYKYV